MILEMAPKPGKLQEANVRLKFLRRSGRTGIFRITVQCHGYWPRHLWFRWLEGTGGTIWLEPQRMSVAAWERKRNSKPQSQLWINRGIKPLCKCCIVPVEVPVLEPDEGAAEKDEEAEEDQENNGDDGENMKKWGSPRRRWVTSPGIKPPTLPYIAGGCNAEGLKWTVLNDSKPNFALTATSS